MTELARARHLRHEGFASEWVHELGSMARERRLLTEARNGRQVCWLEADDEAEPLVTVRIATRDRPEALRDVCLAAVTTQSYERIEILVVGDGCGPETERAVRGLDPRLRYVNLPRPGRYPVEPVRRWRVAGVKPMNAALDLAAGDWIAPCDDDDAFTPTHVEDLLGRAKSDRLELVWSLSDAVDADSGATEVTGGPVMRRGATTHGALVYSMGLSFLRYSMTADRLREPADWNLWKRMRLAGVRMGFLDAVTYRYFSAGVRQYETSAAPLPEPDR